MTNWLVNTFIKDKDNYMDAKVRGKYGTLSSSVGIVCNVFLFAVKYLIGIISNSIAITSDAFNNLSDSASCIVTLFGYKMASKPADKDHPFGHGRMEYLISLVIAMVIMGVGFNFLRSSADKVIHPENVKFSFVALIVLIISILVKVWMAIFNRKLGTKIQSSIMIATSKDSANDVIATTSTVVALVASIFTKLPVDGLIGIVVSVFIMMSGYGIIKDTVDVLLGKPADPELVSELKSMIMSHEGIIGIHDMIIHNYGPGKMIGSLHAEVRCDQNILEIHDIIDQIEREIYSEYSIIMTIHMDPIETDNEFVNKSRKMIENIIIGIDNGLTIHDFRLVTGPTHTNLIFDLVIPYECKKDQNEIKEKIDDQLSKIDGKWYCVITFEKEYV